MLFLAHGLLGIDPDEEGLAYKGELDMGKELGDAYRVYPNPAKEAINIELLTDVFTEQTEVIVMDIMGRIVLQYYPAVSVKSIVLPVHNLQSGVYILQVKEIDRILFSERIVVNK